MHNSYIIRYSFWISNVTLTYNDKHDFMFKRISKIKETNVDLIDDKFYRLKFDESENSVNIFFDKKTFERPTAILIYHQHSTSTNSFDSKSINSSSIDKKSL